MTTNVPKKWIGVNAQLLGNAFDKNIEYNSVIASKLGLPPI